VFDGDDESTEVREVFALERGAVTPDTLGLGGSRETAWLGRRFDGPRDTAAPGSVGAV